MSAASGVTLALAGPRQAESRSWSALRYFNFYRIVIAGLFAVLAATGKMPPSLTALDARLLMVTAILYLAVQGARALGNAVVSRFARATVLGSLVDAEPDALRAWRTGERQVYVDPGDPWPLGYRVSDTWPAL